MSVHFTSPVWKLDLPPTVKMVLLKLADNATDEGICWPYIETVARECGLGQSTVREKVQTLRTDGVLIVKRGGKGGRRGHALDPDEAKRGASTVYWIDIERAKTLYRPGGPGFGGGADADPPAPANPPDAGGLNAAGKPPDDGLKPPDDGLKPPAPGAPSIEEPSRNHQEPSEAPPVVPPARYCGPRTVGALDAAVAVAEGAALAAAVQAWNRLAMEHGFAAVQRLDDGRRKRLRARLAECGGLAGWEAALAKVAASRHLHGHNRDGFRATFDFLTRPANFTQVMEGSYDDRNRGTPEPGTPGSTPGSPGASRPGGGGRAGPQSAVQSALAGIRRAVDSD